MRHHSRSSRGAATCGWEPHLRRQDRRSVAAVRYRRYPPSQPIGERRTVAGGFHTAGRRLPQLHWTARDVEHGSRESTDWHACHHAARLLRRKTNPSILLIRALRSPPPRSSWRAAPKTRGDRNGIARARGERRGTLACARAPQRRPPHAPTARRRSSGGAAPRAVGNRTYSTGIAVV